MTTREIAESFILLAGTGKVKEAFDKFVAPDFVHHNQYFEGSRDALQKAMEEAHQNDPNSLIEIKHSYIDNDSVITHSRVVKKDCEIAVVHIFRFEANKIVELWDLGQIIERDSPNKNGLF